jgi:aryl-alcohol dehydrogenase-like predicted oxidoreductase
MIQTKPFGKTGHSSTRTIFGAASLGKVSQEDADRTLDVLLKHGINHIDVAASYGEAELRVAPWLKSRRKDFFLATKTGERTYDKAKAQFHLSLERLGVDSVDLIQMHNLTDPDEWETAMGPGGALEALKEARDEGLTRFIGVTGHGMFAPRMHLKSIERFDVASVLLPYNYVVMSNPDYAADFERLVGVCKQKGIAIQTIKSIARKPWGPEGRKRNCWYEPLEDQGDIDKAASWVLGNPDVFLLTVGDIDVLPRVLEAAAKNLPRPSDAEMRSLVASRGMELIFEGAQALSH